MDLVNPTAVLDGMVVSLDYVLTVDGDIIDTTSKREPLEYLHGANNIINGLEQALTGMQLGESKQVEIPAREAYGELDPAKFAEIDRSLFPAGYALELGGSLHVRDEDGNVQRAYIDAIEEQTVRLNLNHPLAGKDLSFWAQIAAIRPATDEELSAGRVGGACTSCSSSDCGSGSCSC